MMSWCGLPKELYRLFCGSCTHNIQLH